MKEKNMTILESKKELFEAPEVEIVLFLTDVIAESNGNGYGEDLEGEENTF